MALEASIVERLQELRKWQIDQQERLLKQQQEQRELLSIEQERMYEALGLSIKDVIADESIIDRMSASKIKEHVETLNDHETNQIIINDVSQDTPNISKQQINSLTKDSSTFGGLEEQSNMKLNVPDVCLKSFDTDSTPTDTSNYKNLPQYKLEFDTNNEAINETPKRFCRNNFEIREEGIAPLVPDKSLSKSILIDELPVPSPKKDFKTLLEEKLRDEGMNVNNSASMKNQIKRPFLRKGDGLARFQFNSNCNKVKKSVRQRNTTRSTNVSSNKSQQNINTKNAVEKPKVINKNKKSGELTRKSIGTIANVVQQKLILSNVALPKKFVRNSKSLPSSISSSISPQNVNKLIERCASNDESNQSDLDSSKLETKMFEMLEEKAENSSFCSTSSAVVAFMQQSTPLKLKNIRTNILSQSQIKNESIDRSKGKILNEVISKWDSGPFINDNVSQTITKSTQQNLRKIMQPTNQKDQQFQYHKNESVQIINPEIEDDAKNLSCCTDIDSQYENNCQDERRDLSHNYNDIEEKTETNVSMHVRFAEYNEYKTIGLTDTSMLSTDSQSAAIYDKEKDWSDHSDSEESSDSEIFPLKKNVACQQHMTNDTSKLINPSLDQYDCIDPNYRVNNKALIKTESSENTEDSDSNSIEQSTDDEHSLFNDSEGTCYDEDTTISGIQEAMAKVLNDKDLEIETVPQDTMKSSTQSVTSVTDQTIFKSDLLKNRLLELEREIEIFRKENAALSLQRQKIQDEHRKLLREFKEKQINLERERNQLTASFQEEKKRLAREKSALENRLRDAREKSIQTKHERQEIQLLNEQLNELKDDMVEKESRWQAAQARQRSQIRVLQMENSKLKLEIERLKATKRVNGKLKPPSVISNTKAIHKINKQLDGKRADLQRRISISDEELEPTKNTQKKIVDATSSSSSTNHTSPSTIDTGKIIVYNSNTTHKPTVIKSTEETVSKKRHLYETLLKDAALDGHDCGHKPNSPIIMDRKNDELINLPINYENKSDIDLRSKSTSTENEFTSEPLTNTIFQYPNKLPHSDGDAEQCDNAKINDIKKAQISQLNDKLQPHPQIRGSYEQFVCDIINPRNEGNQFINSNNSDSNNGNMGHKLPNVRNSYPQLNYSPDKTKLCTDQVHTFSPSASIDKQIEKKNLSVEKECVQVEQKKRNYESDRMKVIYSSDPDLTPRKEPQNPLPRPPDNMTPHPENIQLSQISNLSISRKHTSALPSSSSSSPLINKNIREVKHPDGHTEYWYPNGNVKRIYPDRNITKMIYYNGDVRETTSDGCIKYFYAASKTWHTTYPDGFEMIEFPDGQQERRTKDGIVEVSFPDGSVRLMQPDGIEKWALPDGTIAETFPNGEKILSLPNGQREIHTADHKRREYPDGTVKFVYPDGTQETRYSNGRVRIKDKDGNLVMDSHQS